MSKIKSKKQWNLKKVFEKLPGNDDDILVIYSNTLETLDTIGYSSTGITIDANYPHFISVLLLIMISVEILL
jgi:hypothetical protein